MTLNAGGLDARSGGIDEVFVGDPGNQHVVQAVGHGGLPGQIQLAPGQTLQQAGEIRQCARIGEAILNGAVAVGGGGVDAIQQVQQGLHRLLPPGGTALHQQAGKQQIGEDQRGAASAPLQEGIVVVGEDRREQAAAHLADHGAHQVRSDLAQRGAVAAQHPGQQHAGLGGLQIDGGVGGIVKAAVFRPATLLQDQADQVDHALQRGAVGLHPKKGLQLFTACALDVGEALRLLHARGGRHEFGLRLKGAQGRLVAAVGQQVAGPGNRDVPGIHGGTGQNGYAPRKHGAALLSQVDSMGEGAVSAQSSSV